MTPHKQRVAIAEYLGAKWSHVIDSEFETKWQLGFSYKNESDGTHFLSPGTYFQVAYEVARKPDNRFKHVISADVPDYLNDLNAMHEAEKVLTIEQQAIYWPKLHEIVGADENTGHWCDLKATGSATAAQRAEAFLRCLGLWEEEG